MRNCMKGATQYTWNMVELNIPDVRGRTPLYTRDQLEVRGKPTDILEVREKPTQMKYVGEPHDPQNVVLTSNDNSYSLWRRNTSLAYHTVSKIFN